jgi:hypothetical protein
MNIETAEWLNLIAQRSVKRGIQFMKGRKPIGEGEASNELEATFGTARGFQGHFYVMLRASSVGNRVEFKDVTLVCSSRRPCDQEFPKTSGDKAGTALPSTRQPY